MPICKFIVSSLPLEQLITASHEPIKTIDYACGAGHFLTEYALQLPPLLANLKQQDDPHPWHRQIYGIEKEDRLAKVAKVSAFMYGFESIHILDADALVRHAEIKEAGFQVLIANPPFAVEDFLLTVPEEERERFELLGTVNDLGNKNVQCFFLERAQQLLAAGGVMGVIVPSSILSNTDAMHTATREILLKYFDFVALTELGGNTFGKTGTNTVILFLRRKAQRPEPAEHFANRVQDFFENWADEAKAGGGEYLDIDVVAAYCTQTGLDYNAYQTLLLGAPNDALLASDLFKDYRRAFDALPDIKKLKEHKKKTTEEKTAELATRFIQFCRDKERDKLYYFMLAYYNPTPVLLIKSPADNKAQQQFLGYEWSGAKGQEGIRYLGGDSVKAIQTPLFDPNCRDNPEKLSALVRGSFDGQQIIIPATLQPYANQVQLTDLLDFGRAGFDKVISLNAKAGMPVILSKWSLVKLADLAEIIKGVTYKKTDEIGSESSNIILTAESISLPASFTPQKYTYLDESVQLDEGKRLLKGDIFMCFASGSKTHIGKSCFIPEDTHYYAGGFMGILRVKDHCLPHYLFEILNENTIRYQVIASSTGSNINNLSSSLGQLKLPLPPLNIQQQIAAECEVVDKAVESAKKKIDTSRNTIEAAITSVANDSLQRLADVVQVNPSKAEVKSLPDDLKVSFVEMASVSEQGFIAHKVDKSLKDVRKGSYTYFAENDVIVAKITPCMENGKCALATGLTNGVAFGSTEFHVFRAGQALQSRFLFSILNRDIIRKQAEQNFTGSSGHRRVPAAFYENLQIPVPPLDEQTRIVAEIAALEADIAASQAVIDAAPAQKQAVLRKYL